MKAEYSALILKTTEGYFDELDVPQLYVEIQTLRGELERKINRQISFEDALYSWTENIYQPIMQAIEKESTLALLSLERKMSEIYFAVYEKAEKDGFRNIPKAEADFLKENSKGLFTSILALLHHQKAKQKIKIAC